MANPLKETEKKRFPSVTSERKYGNKWEPVYNKKVNIKKLENLLINAIEHGETTVSLDHGVTTITLHELEDIIREKRPKNYKIHPLLSVKDEDIIPWWYDNTDLSLVYKDQDNNKYYVDDVAYLSSFDVLKYSFSQTVGKHPFTQVTHEYTAIDENLNEHQVPFTLYVQNSPANRVFVNSQLYGQIDVFPYNISYLYIGERRHDARTNNNIDDFVKFIGNKNTGDKLWDNTFTYSGDNASYIGYDKVDDNNKSIKFVKNSLNGHILSLNSQKAFPITEVKEVNGVTESIPHQSEVWTIDKLDFLPALSTNSSNTNSNIHTAHSKIAVTTGISNVITNSEQEKISVEIHPYISELKRWKEDSDWDDWTKHANLLYGNVSFVNHSIVPDAEYIVDSNNTIYCTYMVSRCNLDLTTRFKMTYSVDTVENKYDFSKSTENYTYKYVCKNKDLTLTRTLLLPYVKIKTELYNESNVNSNYVLKESAEYNPTSVPVTFKHGKHICDDFSIKPIFHYMNPLTGNNALDAGFATRYDVVVRSNPQMKCNWQLKSEIDRQENNLLKFTLTGPTVDSSVDDYPSVSYVGKLKDIGTGSTVVMNEEQYSTQSQTYIVSSNIATDVELLDLYYTYQFVDCGKTTKNKLKTPIKEYSFDDLVHNCRYTYMISDDNTHITDPEINFLGTPVVNVNYYGKNAILNIESDEFTIWNSELQSINHKTISSYFVKNSKICVNTSMLEENNSTVKLNYLHKGNYKNKNLAGTLQVQITKQYPDEELTWDTDVFECNNHSTKVQWNYAYNVYNDILEYTDINYTNSGDNNVYLDYDSYEELVNKIIPNKVFSVLYQGYKNNQSEGFYYLEESEQVQFENNGLTLQGFATLKPSNDNEIDNFYYVNYHSDDSQGSQGSKYPVYRYQYYLCKDVNNDISYYLYCILTTHNGVLSHNEHYQILPPFIYKLNKFTPVETELEFISDYETFIDNKLSVNEIDLLCSKSDDNLGTYVLAGYNKDIVRSISIDPYANKAQSSHRTNEEFNLVNGNVTLGKVNMSYILDSNKKLNSIEYTLSDLVYGISYNYSTEYTGKIDHVNLKFNTEIKVRASHTPKNVTSATYIRTTFEDNNVNINPVFRMTTSAVGTLCNTSDYIITPTLINDYEQIRYTT